MMRVISLGWGVQSFTLAAMSALGELPPVDAAIFSDTTHERAATTAFAAQWTPWLEQRGVRVVTVVGVSTGIVARTGPGGDVIFVDVPAYTISAGGQQGRIRRQCTHEWKLRPLRTWLQANRHGAPVETWLGISTDEWQRARDADVKYIRNVYPLLDKGMSRRDCLTWLTAHDLPSPGKSSCTFCPFQTLGQWRAMKRDAPQDWANAVEGDAAIRNIRPPGELFVHPSCAPLNEAVTIPEDFGYSQLDLLQSNDADAECDSGYCMT